MAFLGIRCSNNDYCYVILEGTRVLPKIKNKANISFPRGFSRAQSLKWFLQEIEDLLKKYPSIKVISIKGSEPMASRGKSFTARVENEAMVFLAAANVGIKAIFKKTKPTIAKDLGLKGRGKYLSTQLDCSVIPNYDDESDKIKEAILVAWSCTK
ncbi:MAG TPA: hypothetical protein ENH52_15115 [Nitrospirae bacterium]|nr:hypothetical protein [Nitrospirota bacterium]